MGYTAFRFGTLYLDQIPQHIPQNPQCEGDIPAHSGTQTITIGDTHQGEAITWIKPDGMNILIADRVLLTDVSWEQLQRDSFIPGKGIAIDGKHYFCRLLWCGTSKEELNNEWDLALTRTSDAHVDNDLWHWKKCLFWGNEEPYENHRVVRGCNRAEGRGVRHFRYHNEATGFRPCLLPIPQLSRADFLTMLEEQKFAVFHLANSTNNTFCPILKPINMELFDGIPEGSIIKMYTLLVNGKPERQDLRTPSSNKSSVELAFTDKYYGDEYLIPWIISTGIATAARAVFKGGANTKFEF